MNKPLTEILDGLTYPESIYKWYMLKPNMITNHIDLIVRLKCQACGLFKRAILCPSYLWKTYPQFKTFKSTKNFIRSFDAAVVFVWKNDGTKSWKINKEELRHIEFEIKKGKQLKGTEASQSRELTKLMKNYSKTIKKERYKTFPLTVGHCDL